MKVIFLDNDGVICLQHNWGSRYKKQHKVYDGRTRPSMKKVIVETRFDDFDKKAVKVLNSILDETGADIVVSSDWRNHATLDELGDYYESQGIIKRPIGVTEKFHFKNWLAEGFIKDHDEFPWSKAEDLEQERHFEIKRWLKDHPQITHWVAVDDLNMGMNAENEYWGIVEREWGLENFVWTPRINEGIKQCGIKEKILKFLF